MSLPILRFVLTAAFRDKIMMTFAVLVLLAASLSNFFGGASLTEQSDFVVVYKASALRFVGILTLILFISVYVRRAFESKEVEYMLTRSISRLKYLASHAVAFLIIAFLITAVVSAVIYMSGPLDFEGWRLWSFSLLVEYAIIAMISMFFSMVITSASGAALACFALYALARMVGVLLGIANLPAESSVLLVLSYTVEFISVFVPRFDLMGQTGWLVYGVNLNDVYEIDRFASSGFSLKAFNTLGMTLYLYVQAVAFCGLFFVASAFDFVRKQF